MGFGCSTFLIHLSPKRYKNERQDEVKR